MFNRLILILVLLIPFVAKAEIQDGPLTLILAGSKDQVLSVVHEAMGIEFSRGTTNNLTDQAGFRSNFRGFFTGQTEVKAWLVPVVDGDSLEPTAFQLGFSWQTQRNDGKQHVTDLIKQIRTIAAKHGDVIAADSPVGYRLLPEQTARCFGFLPDDPELASLKEKMALDSVEMVTFSMLANDSIPTDDERKAISLYASKRDTCLKPMMALKSFFPNDPVLPLYRTTLDAAEQVILSLYKGQLSYGSFAKIRKENYIRFEDARMKIVTEMKANDAAALDRAQHLALEQQRVFIEQQQAYASLYRPQILAVPAIRSTHCQIIGNQVNCNSF